MLTKIIVFLKALAARRRVERELDEELRFHVEMETQANIGRGMPEAAARREALIALGGVEQTREAVRDVFVSLELLTRDVVHAVRALRRAPAFTFFAAATLALGVGANTTLFSLAYGIVSRPLPYPEPSRLVLLANQRVVEAPAEVDWTRNVFLSRREFEHLAHASRAFDGLALWSTTQHSLSAPADTVSTTLVSPDFFRILRMPPELGRYWQPNEDSKSVAAISDRLWRRRFNADPQVLGRGLAINGVTFTIVAVVRSDFALPSRQTDIWLPFAAGSQLASREFLVQGVFTVLGRLKSGITLRQADDDVRRALDGLESYRRITRIGGREIAVAPLADELVRNVRLPLALLMGFASFVLVIACVNLMNLALARATARLPELALRVVLGATRQRLLQRVLVEGLLLGGLGAAGAVLFAVGSLPLVLRLCPAGMPRLEAVRLDWPVLAFAVAAAATTAVICAVGPAVIVMKKLSYAPQRLNAMAGQPAGLRWHRALVVVEVALSTAVLIGAGLFTNSLVRLLATQTGVETANVLTARINVAPNQYGAPRQQRDVFGRVLDRLRRQPGVLMVGVGTSIPPDRSYGTLGFAVGDDATGRIDMASFELVFASPGYLEALRIPVVSGRGFSRLDGPDARRVALLSERAAKLLFREGPVAGWARGHQGAAEEVLGRTVPLGRGESATVVGIVGDVRYSGLSQPPNGAVYIPFAQRPFPRTYLAMRTSLPPQLLIAPVRKDLAAVDPGLEVLGLQPLEDALADSVLQPRLRAFLAAVLAGLAILLTGVGVYGVTTYTVSLRTHDVGVMRALGASTAVICWAFIKPLVWLYALGAVLGLATAASFSGVLGRLLFVIPPIHWLTYAGSTLGLGILVVVATLVPAWHTARLDPTLALKWE